MVTDAEVATFECDGVVCLRGLVEPEWIERLRDAVEQVMASPGSEARDITEDGGRFFTDIYMHRTNPTIRAFLTQSGIGAAAGRLLSSHRARLYNDHLLVKEPGTDAPTPWHQDLPYFRCDGRQLASFWIGLDPVTRDSGAMSFVRGSHRWGKMFQPVSFASGDALDADEFDGPLPQIEGREDLDFVCYEMEPGDATFHHVLTLHGAQGNATLDRRRRGLSVRLAGDDAVWLRRRFSPSGIEAGLPDGAPLTGDLFPLLWSDAAATA
ncbi:phytanoyl-CoA dioxygenase family protein [Phenylobacterium sp. VNQ135]|uniref:phytanoyl-CoA dioxygenase family protein n=1 Tax=Phenylobacterium sp. VNQ135 TaxID=3400922 RepID=UPI003BFDBAEC